MIFGVTIFLSAFLLFQLELISAKQLLPWFGGAPAVWTACQVFYQVVLLGGYAYAHWLTDKFSPQRQRLVHVILLLGSAVVLVAVGVYGGVPLLAPASMKPSGSEQPLAQLIKILVLSNGLPFLALSATGPLLQSWHGRQHGSLDRTYRLYALSNVGSLLGLLSYPFAIERLLALPSQAWTWTCLFGLFAAACATVSWTAGQTLAAPKLAAAESPREKLASPVMWLWILLPLVTSALFLATTNELCQEVAVIPFLWVLPLAIYLASFIVCFDRPGWYSRGWSAIIASVAGLLIVLKPAAATIPVPAQILVHSIFLGAFCIICHGELVRLRPKAERLTLFYLMIAVGGALGGGFVSLLAPEIFRGYWELRTTMLMGWAVLGLAWWADAESPWHRGDRSFFLFALLIGSLMVTPFFLVKSPLRGVSLVAHHPYVFVGLGALLLTTASGLFFKGTPLAVRPLWPRGLLFFMFGTSALMLVRQVSESRGDTVFAARNFFGAVRVIAVKDRLTNDVVAYKLVHGVTNHGVQFTDPRWKDVPTTYYSRQSGVALAAKALEERRAHLNIGVLGLGAGTIASYARRGDSVRFYELDPIVISLAGKGSRYFSFLDDCLGHVEVAAGDARLSLERELASKHPGDYDLMALDAFSGDAIPVHLLTAEAFRIYRDHLRDDSSILAIHITNAYLDLEPVIAAAARVIGMQGVRVDASGTESQLPESSSWILLSRRPAIFEDELFRAANARPLGPREILFTDRYSNLFRVLK